MPARKPHVEKESGRELRCRARNDGGDDDVEPLVDDEFEIFGHLGEAILVFADGFESGDFDAWIALP